MNRRSFNQIISGIIGSLFIKPTIVRSLQVGDRVMIDPEKYIQLTYLSSSSSNREQGKYYCAYHSGRICECYTKDKETLRSQAQAWINDIRTQAIEMNQSGGGIIERIHKINIMSHKDSGRSLLHQDYSTALVFFPQYRPWVGNSRMSEYRTTFRLDVLKIV